MSMRSLLDGILNEAAGSRPADKASNGDQASKKIETDVTATGGFGGSTKRSADKSGEQAAKEGTKISDPSGNIQNGKGTEVQGNTETHKGLGEATEEVTKTVAESIASLVEYEVDMSAIRGLCEAQELDEAFANQAVEIFEAAVNDIVKTQLNKICEAADAVIAEAVETQVANLEEQVDRYLNYVVTEWAEENRLAIEQSARVELAESFMNNLKGLLEDHYVDIPESKVDLYEAAIAQGEMLYAKLQEAESQVVELSEAVVSFEKNAIVESVVDGMSELQAEKVRALAESINFDGDFDTFREKVSIISEGYSKPKAKASALVEDAGQVVEQVDSQVSAPYVDPVVAAAAQAISRFK